MSWDVTATNESNGGGSGEIPPAGNHPAVLIGLIDLGTHDEEYKGKSYTARKALLVFELTAEHAADGSTFVITQDLAIYSKMSKKSKLRLFLESWRGRPLEDKENINLLALLGKKCLANVTHGKSAKGNDFAKLAGVAPVPKGMSVPEPTRVEYCWSFGQPRDIPDWVPYLYGRDVNDIIDESYEARGVKPSQGGNGATVGAGVGADDDSDVPF